MVDNSLGGLGVQLRNRLRNYILYVPITNLLEHYKE